MSTDPPPSSVTLQALTVDRLGGSIARGDLPPGTIVNPEKLSEEFGVSRTVIRESLRALEALGMINARPRAGTVVRPVASWNLLDQRVICWRHGGPDATRQLQELIMLREAVEPIAAEGAAALMTPEDVDDLRCALRRMRDAFAADDTRVFALADADFHATILRVSGNTVLKQLLATLEAALRLRYTEFSEFSPESESALTRHGELVESLARGDSAAAGGIMRTLIRETREELWRPERAGGS